MAFKVTVVAVLLVLSTIAGAGPIKQIAPAGTVRVDAADGGSASDVSHAQVRGDAAAPTQSGSDGVLMRARAIATWVSETLANGVSSLRAPGTTPQAPVQLPVSAADLKLGDSVRIPQSAPDFLDNFDGNGLDGKWLMSDGWANGQPFRNGWSNQMYGVGNGELTLKVRKEGFQDPGSATGHGKWFPYTAGELRSRGYYGVGCYTVCMKPSKVSGFSSSMYLLSTEHDTPDDAGRDRNELHNEIDIEFVGKNTRQFQTNFFSRVKDPYANSGSGVEVMHQLPFDAADNYHAYGIKWTNEYIEWYVDGQQYRSVSATEYHIPSPRYSTMRILANIWPVNDQAQEWAGTLNHDVYETQAKYTSMSFNAGESCSVRSSC